MQSDSWVLAMCAEKVPLGQGRGKERQVDSCAIIKFTRGHCEGKSSLQGSPSSSPRGIDGYKNLEHSVEPLEPVKE
jgi:hypothetical protein